MWVKGIGVTAAIAIAMMTMTTGFAGCGLDRDGSHKSTQRRAASPGTSADLGRYRTEAVRLGVDRPLFLGIFVGLFQGFNTVIFCQSGLLFMEAYLTLRARSLQQVVDGRGPQHSDGGHHLPPVLMQPSTASGQNKANFKPAPRGKPSFGAGLVR